jgi:hypothetical protein
MSYRKLTEKEIEQLKSQCCRSREWESIEVDENFRTDYVHIVAFSGKIRLGRFDSVFTFEGGVRKHSGLYNVALHNCEIGDNVIIENVNNYIANYKIGNDTLIQQVDRIVVDKKTTFGNGVEVAVLNETGGREVRINDKLTAHVAYILALYRHRPELVAKLNAMIDEGN